MEAVQDAISLWDELTRLTAILDAQIATVAGEGIENFRGLNKELQANYLWGLSENAMRLKEVARALSTARAGASLAANGELLS